MQRRLNLGGTLICDRALLTGDVDVYVEYTGTALTAIFHQPVVKDPAAVIGTVRELYANSGRTLLAPLGYDNTFAILVRGADARARGLRTIDDVAAVAPGWRAGFGYEFLERPDGYPGLAKTYGLTFRGPPQVMDLTLSYRALAAGTGRSDRRRRDGRPDQGPRSVSTRRQPPLLSALRRGAGRTRIHAAAVSAGAEGAGRTGRPDLCSGHAGDEPRGRGAARGPRGHRAAIPESVTALSCRYAAERAGRA